MSRIYTSPYPDISIPRRSIFTHVFSRPHNPNSPAYIDAPTGKTLSRADVHAQSLQLAWALRNLSNLETGAVIAVFSPNSLWWPVVLLGSIAAGACLTTINSAYTPGEDSRAYLIFVHPTLLGTMRAALSAMGVGDAEMRRRIILAGADQPLDGWQRIQDYLGKGQLDKEIPFDGDAAHQTALLCYSSGTTSFPKGVQLTHHNIVSIPCIVEHSWSSFLHPQPGSMLLSLLPFYHVYGLVKLLLVPLFFGAPQAIMTRFDPDQFCANIERYKVTVALIVPPIAVVLASHPAPEKYDLRSLKRLFSGAAPLGRDLIHALRGRMLSLGADVTFTQGYGLTETSPTIHMLDEAHWETKMGSVGYLMPNVRARLVVDDEGLVDAGEDKPGELWVQGPGVMKGYLNNPSATAGAITQDGWFKTGDVAVVDRDGYFRIVDRKKELIKYKGFQVPPAELESVLLTHPNVIDAAVIGVWNDAEATELPLAYIVPRTNLAPHAVSALCEDVQKWVKGKVARHKYLRGGVAIINTIPKSASGKILRRELRELAKTRGDGMKATAKL